VELPVFAAGVDAARQRRNEVFIDQPANGAFIQVRVIHTARDRQEAQRQELIDQPACVFFPKRENAAHANHREIRFAPSLEILQEYITEGRPRDPFLLPSQKVVGHLSLIFIV
jgi:hypothetical protein